jgi:hypothetical protein
MCRYFDVMGIFFLHSEFWGMDLGTKQGQKVLQYHSLKFLFPTYHYRPLPSNLNGDGSKVRRELTILPMIFFTGCVTGAGRRSASERRGQHLARKRAGSTGRAPGCKFLHLLFLQYLFIYLFIEMRVVFIGGI